MHILDERSQEARRPVGHLSHDQGDNEILDDDIDSGGFWEQWTAFSCLRDKPNLGWMDVKNEGEGRANDNCQASGLCNWGAGVEIWCCYWLTWATEICYWNVEIRRRVGDDRFRKGVDDEFNFEIEESLRHAAEGFMHQAAGCMFGMQELNQDEIWWSLVYRCSQFVKHSDCPSITVLLLLWIVDVSEHCSTSYSRGSS